MRAEELYSLLRGVDNSFEIYTNLVTADLGMIFSHIPVIKKLNCLCYIDLFKYWCSQQIGFDASSSGTNPIQEGKRNKGLY